MTEIERLAAAALPWIDSGFPDRDAQGVVRAILKAMREPSVGVLKAGWDCPSAGWNTNEPDVEGAWQAMIDHILAEPS